MLVVALAGCARSNDEEEAAHALLQGRFAEAVGAARPVATAATSISSFSVANFVLSVGYYFLGNTADSSTHRLAWAGSEQSRKEVLGWIASSPSAPDAQPWVTQFVGAVAAEFAGDGSKAKQLYAAAAEASPFKERVSANIIAMSAGVMLRLEVPQEKPVTYSGMMWVENEAWVPVNPDEVKGQEFKVTGGTLLSTLGELTLDASFGSWAYVKRKGSGEIVSWAPLVTKGKILTKGTSGMPVAPQEKAAKEESVVVECKYVIQPFDYAGRYVIVDLDGAAGSGFPLVVFRSGGSAWFGLGAQFAALPDAFHDAKGFFGGHAIGKRVENGALSGPVRPLIGSGLSGGASMRNTRE